MSIPESADSVRYHCCREKCDASFPPGNGHQGGFCSQDCYHIHIGQKRLKQLTDDPRYCSTSFVCLREFRPRGRKAHSRQVVRDDDGTPVAYRRTIPDWVKSREYITAETKHRIDTIQARSPAGTIHHGQVERPNTVENAIEYGKNLSRAVDRLRRDGKHDYSHDREMLIQTLRESGDGDGACVYQDDYARALGAAIASPDN